MRRILWVALAAILFLPAESFAQSAVISAGGGNASIIGGDVDGWVTHVVFDFADGVNQIDVARNSTWVDARTAGATSLAFYRDPCKNYQVDVVWGLAPAARYTMSDLGNLPLLASKMLPATSPCRNPPDAPPTAPPPPPSCPTYTFNVGGSPAIARFPPGYVNPWLPTTRGPFYFSVPAGRYNLTVVTGDNHVGAGGKNDGPQPQEIAWIVLDYGQWIGPTKDIDDDKNEATSPFRVNLLMDVQKFWVVHAGTRVVTEPTDSFYLSSVTLRCVE